jgi:membrane fusion protein (multidrug efflux system)
VGRVPFPSPSVALRAHVLALCALAACGGSESADGDAGRAGPAEVAPIRVARATAEARKIPIVKRYVGTLAAERTARLAADANGRVTAVRVDRGSVVRKGDVLIEVDTALTGASSDAARAQADLVRAQYEAAKADCARLETLAQGGAIATAEADRARAGCVAQGKAVEAAEAQVRLAGTQVSRAQVRAPFDGVVADRMTQIGEFVGMASPVATVMTLDPMRARFSIPERDLPLVREGATVRVRVASAGGASVEGRILPLPPTARDQLRDMLIEASLPNPDGALRAGLSAEVEVLQGERDGVVVPATALVQDDTAHRLWVIRDGRAVELLVHVDAELDGLVAVSPGLAAGETVVDRPVGLRDGAAVE